MMAEPIEQLEVALRYGVRRWSPDWAVPEVPVPESDTHDVAIDYLKALLLAWAARSGRAVKVARNLGIRWVQAEPRAGFDPDLCVIEPPPPADEPLTSLRLWEPGHVAPVLAIEVVSTGHPYKDYVDTPERCAACGVGELWVYDPMLAGPAARGGPVLLQVWQRGPGGAFERIHAGPGPVRSPALEAWLHPRASRLPAGARLVMSADREGHERWPTLEEQARRSEQQARALLDQIRAERDGLEQRVRELEARLTPRE
jgi:Uma2 family endonuclease